MPETLSTAQYQALVGQQIGQSGWIKITQEMIDQFCETTGDYQFIHNDPKRAKTDTPFGGAVAHGFLTLAMVTQIYKDSTPKLAGHELVINYGINRLRFLTPVPSGVEIKGEVTLGSYTEKGPGRVLTENEIVLHVKGADKPAMLCTWLTLLVADGK